MLWEIHNHQQSTDHVTDDMFKFIYRFNKNLIIFEAL